MGAAFTPDEVKYIKAIGDYNSKKIAHLPELMRIILPLKDVSRRVKDNYTVKNRKKGGKVQKMRGGGIVRKKLTYKIR